MSYFIILAVHVGCRLVGFTGIDGNRLLGIFDSVMDKPYFFGSIDVSGSSVGDIPIIMFQDGLRDTQQQIGSFCTESENICLNQLSLAGETKSNHDRIHVITDWIYTSLQNLKSKMGRELGCDASCRNTVRSAKLLLAYIDVLTKDRMLEKMNTGLYELGLAHEGACRAKRISRYFAADSDKN